MTNFVDCWQTAAGTVLGKDHRRAAKNNQDAYCLAVLPSAIAAVVSDGCGSSPHSEVGAQLGARLLTNELAQLLNSGAIESDWQKESIRIRRTLARASDHLLAQINILARGLSGSFSQTLNDYFLFTLIGVVVTPSATAIFSVGDGLYAINGEIVTLGPFPGNYPPYLAYELLRGDGQQHFLPEINVELPTNQLVSVLVGTDGATDLANNANHNLPGAKEILGDIDQFWYEDRYFSNPDNIRRRLTLANRETKTADWHGQKIDTEHGLLNDDTTIAVIRRGKEV